MAVDPTIEAYLKMIEKEMAKAMDSAVWEYAPKDEINGLIEIIRKLNQ